MFSKEDEVFHKALMKILDDATYPLKAREVKSFLAVYDWCSKLPIRVEALCLKEKDTKAEKVVEAEVSKSERKRRSAK